MYALLHRNKDSEWPAWPGLSLDPHMASLPLGSIDLPPPPGFPLVLAWVPLPLAPCHDVLTLPLCPPHAHPLYTPVSSHLHTPFRSQLQHYFLKRNFSDILLFEIKSRPLLHTYILETSPQCFQSTCLGFSLTFIYDYLLNFACLCSLEGIGQGLLVILSPSVCKISCSLHCIPTASLISRSLHGEL